MNTTQTNSAPKPNCNHVMPLSLCDW